MGVLWEWGAGPSPLPPDLHGMACPEASHARWRELLTGFWFCVLIITQLMFVALKKRETLKRTAHSSKAK